jgi:glutathione peroxidase
MQKITGASLLLATSLSFADICPDILDFNAPRLRTSENIQFCEAFAGKALLVVNTASRCGFTSQFQELEELYKIYKDEGLAIVGFPSNDFRQEYSNAEKTAEVCYVNYGVTFDMVKVSSVTGLTANKLFKRLRKQTGKSPGWNFNKFLISPDGSQVKHFSGAASPRNGDLEAAVRAML